MLEQTFFLWKFFREKKDVKVEKEALSQTTTQYFSFLQVYDDSLLKASAKFGPLSKEAERALRILDGMIDSFMDRIHNANMKDLVNFIIMSDHGMTYGANPTVESHSSFDGFPYSRHEVRSVSMEAAIRPVGRYWNWVNATSPVTFSCNGIFRIY